MKINVNQLTSDILLQFINGKAKISVIGLGCKSQKYLNIYCGFDIETTKIKVDLSDKITTYHSHMWIWMFSINSNVVYGHTWEEFNNLLAMLISVYNTNSKRRLIVWVANLGFEFQHMRKMLNYKIKNVFAKEERKPIKFSIGHGIEFRDCLTISGGNLAQLAKDFTTTQKAVGDLDYDVIRSNQDEPQNEHEWKYICNDVIILSEWSEYVFNEYIDKQGYIPLTKTGILRHMVKKACEEWAIQEFNSKHGFDYYKILLKDIQPSERFYNLCMSWCFRGGFVHANIRYTDMVLDNIMLADITSSYPAVMFHDYYPVSQFRKADNNRLSEYIEKYCCIIYIEFHNIKTKTWHTIESRSKIIEYSDNAIFDNGRLRSASKIKVLITEIDYDLYKDFYTWDSENVIAIWTAKRGKMPTYLLSVLYDVYINKSKMKHDGLEDTTEYANYKGYVNSAYGLTVTRLISEDISYNDGEWGKVKSKMDYDSQISNTVLLPMQGIYVTAHARHHLLKLVYKIHEYVVYCDTDSIYSFDNDIVRNAINEYNEYIINLNKEMFNNNEYFIDLGAFDISKEIYKFKTLGAKRYIKQSNGKFSQTIAGLPKKALYYYCCAYNKNPFEVFKDGFTITSEDIIKMKEWCEAHGETWKWKMLSVYTDNEYSDIINGVEMFAGSGQALVENTFTLTMTDEYIRLIKEILESEARYNIIT